MIYNSRGSAILISLVILTLITVMSTVFFEKLFHFSQASEGIENSNVAYYKALGIIEDSLYETSVNKYTPWNIANTTCTSAMQLSSGSCMTATTGATSVPALGKGNSPYDDDYNIIGLGEPVQLVVPANISWGSVEFRFRVPQVSSTSSTGIAIGAQVGSGYVLWTLASSGVSLFASGETNIFEGDILNDTPQSIAGENGTTNSGSSLTFIDFYNSSSYLGGGTNGAKCAGYQCTLKLSLIRPVPLDDGRIMTFLEYRISVFGTEIPSQYMTLSADGYAYGFARNRTIQFPQITTNTALDFAVLQ